MTSVFAKERHIGSPSECMFYHTMDLPEFGTVQGFWDLRGKEGEYLGNIEFEGKKVLEIGPASGALTFYMENSGATVTSLELDLNSPSEYCWDIPHCMPPELEERMAGARAGLELLQNSYWLCHRLLRSRSRLVYGNAYNIPPELGRFDVTTLGCVLLQNKNPLGILENAARITRETIVVVEILPGNPKDDDNLVFIREDTRPFDGWFHLPPRFVERVLRTMGFVTGAITYHTQMMGEQPVGLYTLVASRPQFVRTLLRDMHEAGDFGRGIERTAARFDSVAEFAKTAVQYEARLEGHTPAAIPEDEDSVAARICALLDSREFMRKFSLFVIEEFPELRRDLFIHVPKTGGISVVTAARNDPDSVVVRAPSWSPDGIAEWRDHCFEVAKDLFSGAKAILFSAHLVIDDILRYRMAREQDRIFMISREPLSLMLSWLNFVLTCFARTAGRPERNSYVNQLRMIVGVDDGYAPGPTPDWDIVERIVARVITVNPTCRYLGAGDAEAAFGTITRLGIHVYDFDALPLLFAEMGWEPARENVSHPFLAFEDLPPTIRSQVVANSCQDMALRDRLKEAGLLRTMQAPRPRQAADTTDDTMVASLA